MKTDINSMQWLRLLIGLILVFALFHWTADVLGSNRGEFGVIIGLLVVGATIAAKIFLFDRLFKESVKDVGLTWPNASSIFIAIVISVLMFVTIFIFTLITDSSFNFYPEWYLLIPGLFFQAGIAEETLFRGYLFGHIRKKYNFWKAAIIAAVPFILVHLIIFYSLPFAIAAASIFLSVVLSFPLARLFELGGNTIWAPAILHFVVQGTVKVLVASGEAAQSFPLFWITICAIIPLLVFLLPEKKIISPV
jgi:membrane protease YdiL (CAAX protease family)